MLKRFWVIVVCLLWSGCAAGGPRLGGAGSIDEAAAASAELGEGVPPVSEEEELDLSLESDLEPAPELPEDVPEVTPSQEVEIARRLRGFFTYPDIELAEQIDGLQIYRGIPPPDEEVPSDRIPILFNPYVEKWVLYFTGDGSKFFEKWLARLPRYKDLFEGILEEHGVPRDFVYLAMIESGFSNRAYSRAHAVGTWQFIRGTAKLYKLDIDWWLDERRDPVASAHAAARHLKDLHDEFGSWYLAAAAYNAGAGKIRRGLQRYGVKSFWELLEKPYLRSETKNYVPKMLAAMIVAKAPERFGFVGIQPEAPYVFETVKVPESTDLAVAAKALDMDVGVLQDLNPHLRRWFTPPEGGSFELRIPVGTKEAFESRFAKLDKAGKKTFLTHTVRRGETLSQLAYMYDTDMWAIKRLNRIGKYLRAGQTLQIPVRPGTAPRKPPVRLAQTSRMLRDSDYKAPQGHQELMHVVDRGDTLWSIASRFGVSMSDIKRWNAIPRGNKIFPGDVVSVYLPQQKAAAFEDFSRVRVKEDRIEIKNATAVQYRVRKGETGYSIAKKHGVQMADLLSWNPGTNWRLLKPGDTLTLYVLEGATN